MKSSAYNGVVPANPALWSKQSQRSVSASWIKEYRDIPYKCWRCKTEAVFSAQDQKYTFEVLKAPIAQRRVFCEDCWRNATTIMKGLKTFERKWNAEKLTLRKNKEFLTAWLKLLEAGEEYAPYKPDTAKKNMIKKLLADV